jgi:hypothetical protein
MRTGIYVHKATKLTFSANEKIVLDKFPSMQGTAVANGVETTLEPGIYRILSTGGIDVTGAGIGTDAQVVVRSAVNEKDPWPTPPPDVVSLVEVQPSDIVDFFATKGITL